MTRLYLVRHAAHDLIGKALAGRTPGLPLSDEGRAQAARLGERFAGEPLVRILSSPIQRAQETAAAVARHHAVAVETSQALEEIDCGDWTGCRFEQLAADPRWQAWNGERAHAVIPGGEGMEAVQRRVAGLFRTLQGETGPLLLVSHSDVIKAAVALVLDLSLNLHDRLTIDPASITTLDMWGAAEGKIVRMNEVVAP